MLNLTRLHLGIAHESQFQGLGITASPTRIVGGGIMSKRNLIIEEGSVEAMARLQKQDEEFCRRLRAAIETGRECCPTTVFTKPCTGRPAAPSSDA